MEGEKRRQTSGTYRWLLIGAAATLLGLGMLLLNQLAGPITIGDDSTLVQVSTDEAQWAMGALALITVGAATAVASLLASRGDPERPRWVEILSGTLIVIAVISVVVAALLIAFLVALCSQGCN
jgi:hypothetical protein